MQQPTEDTAQIERASFAELKAEAARIADEKKMLPTSVTFDGMQYTLEVPDSAKVEPMAMDDEPGKLDKMLNRTVFVATDGTKIHA